MTGHRGATRGATRCSETRPIGSARFPESATAGDATRSSSRSDVQRHRGRARRILTVLGATVGVATALAALPTDSTAANTVGGCRVLPSSSPWNQRIDSRAVSPSSKRYIAKSNPNLNLSAAYGTDAGGDEWGMPINVVPEDQPGVEIRSTAWEIDDARYPIPRNPLLEGPWDSHMLIVQQGTCKLFELWRAERSGDRWVAGSAAVWDLRKNETRAQGLTSANAAGLPILPGLLSIRDAKARSITHALGVTLPLVQRAWVAPATHTDGRSSDPAVPPMGSRLRLKKGFKTSKMPRQARIIATAMKRYGLIVSDSAAPANGTEYDGFGIVGMNSRSWSEKARKALYDIHLGDFEAVVPDGSGTISRRAGAR